MSFENDEPLVRTIASGQGDSLPPIKKSIAILLLTLFSWTALSIWIGFGFNSIISHHSGQPIYAIFRVSHIAWMLFWLWGVHNFWHQTLSLLPRKKTKPNPPIDSNVPVAILYTTCDDFDPEACASCYSQTHPAIRLIICDDSFNQVSRDEIDRWVREQAPSAVVIRRTDHRGFKAGNLNQAIRNFVTEEFIVVCDADEIIPTDFVSDMLAECSRNGVAFVQARHIARKSGATLFARMLGPTIDIHYIHSLPLRNRYGFVACFGHGMMIRRSAWEAISGFPEIVSEDLGFAALLLTKGLRGFYAENIVAEEAFPPNYTSFVKKYKKIVGGTIEFFQTDLSKVLRSPLPTLTEKLDLVITFSFCFIGLITVINIFGGLVVSHAITTGGYNRIELGVLLLYMLGPLTPIIPLTLRILREPMKYGKYSFSAAIAYASLMPMFARKGIEQLFHIKKTEFEVTGKVAKQPQIVNGHLFTMATGSAVMALAILLPSPALIPAICVSIMFMLAPILCFTERHDLLGFLARNSGLVPYAALIGMLAMH